jgi:ornithine decarboxylase
VEKLVNFISKTYLTAPTLVLDTEQVRQNYIKFKSHYKDVQVFYAVKANPDSKVLRTLHSEGCSFDAASINEIYNCISVGVPCSRISFGNTVKSILDIKEAHNVGITLFAADSEQELEKIAIHAPHSSVYIRMLVQNDKADWPLGRKFGVMPSGVVNLLHYAKRLGLIPVGISFHVGSQAKSPVIWDSTLNQASQIWKDSIESGISLSLLNIGGGFPVKYLEDVVDIPTYSSHILSKIPTLFPGVKTVMAEPGRAIVATAGFISCRVLLVADKADGGNRWVYLNIGRFGGLAETESEAIKYKITIPSRKGELEAFKLAGPTCDSADIIYEKNLVYLPKDVSYDDVCIIHNCGAYTTTYSTNYFNGFPPLSVLHI